MAPHQTVVEIQHAPCGIVSETQPTVAIYGKHPFNHAGEYSGHARAIDLELAHSPSQPRGLRIRSRLPPEHAIVRDDGRKPVAGEADYCRDDEIRQHIAHRYGSPSL